MSLVALVDDSRGSLETGPDALAEILGHGAELLPLLMKLLQLVESVNDVLVLRELLGGFAELLLRLQILLEVEVAEFAVDLHLVVETLYVELIGAVDVPERSGRHRAGGTPPVLDIPECGEGGAHVLASVDQCLQFFYYRFFLFEILFFQCILLFVVLGTFALVVGIETLEVLLDIGEAVFDLAGLAPQFAKQFVECGLDGFGLLAAQHAVRGIHQILEYVRQFRQGLVGKGRLLRGFLRIFGLDCSLFFLNFGIDVFFAHS